jgi:hypothetical protein
MTRETSIEVYHQIVAEGLVGKLHSEILGVLANSEEPLTQKETMSRTTIKQISVVSPRFTELEDMGVIESVGTRPCRVTGRIVTTYRMTGNLPIKKEKKESPRQTIKRLEAELKEMDRAYCNGYLDGVASVVLNHVEKLPDVKP